jgi:hypothetical protein
MAAFDQIVREMGSDEASAAGNQNSHKHCSVRHGRAALVVSDLLADHLAPNARQSRW